MNETETLGVVILPNSITTKFSINLSRKLSNLFKTLFVLDGTKLYPHISLYHLAIPHKTYNKVVQKIESIATSTKPFKISSTRFTFEKLRNVIHWKCEITPELVNLHKRLLEELNPLREGAQINYNLKTYTKEQQANIQKYGYPNSLYQYNPHITINKLGEIENIEHLLKQLPPSLNMSFTAESICLGKLAEYGTITEILEEFPLK